MSTGLLIRDMALRERPRERLSELGPDALSDTELLAILLRTGSRGASALAIAGQLLQRFRTLGELSQTSLSELWQVKGVGRDKAVTLQAAFTLARRMMREPRAEAPLMDEPGLVAAYLREECRGLKVETCWVLLLNARRRLIAAEKISQGLLDSLLVHPREVFRRAIIANAAAVVLAHNHPSGVPTPSETDIKITRDLVRAGQLLRIEVVDHVILGQPASESAPDYASLRELGHCAK